MNLINLNKAIAVMERVKARGDAFEMSTWQKPHIPLARNSLGQCYVNYMSTEEELHTCGTAACFAGWVAVSPEFIADGGGTGNYGRPQFIASCGEQVSNELAIAEWLEIEYSDAAMITGCDPISQGMSAGYGKPLCDVTVDDVLEVLYKWKETAQ